MVQAITACVDEHTGQFNYLFLGLLSMLSLITVCFSCSETSFIIFVPFAEAK